MTPVLGLASRAGAVLFAWDGWDDGTRPVRWKNTRCSCALAQPRSRRSLWTACASCFESQLAGPPGSCPTVSSLVGRVPVLRYTTEKKGYQLVLTSLLEDLVPPERRSQGTFSQPRRKVYDSFTVIQPSNDVVPRARPSLPVPATSNDVVPRARPSLPVPAKQHCHARPKQKSSLMDASGRRKASARCVLRSG